MANLQRTHLGRRSRTRFRQLLYNQDRPHCLPKNGTIRLSRYRLFVLRTRHVYRPFQKARVEWRHTECGLFLSLFSDAAPLPSELRLYRTP